MLWFRRRLRAQCSSNSHGASVAGPLHRHVQAQASGVLGLPGAAEGPRLGERKHRNKEANAAMWPTPISHHLDLSTFLNSLGHFPRQRVSWEGRPAQADREECRPVEKRREKKKKNLRKGWILISSLYSRATTIFTLQPSAASLLIAGFKFEFLLSQPLQDSSH